ncbi:PepSY-associated TM helix domain-containing protein [Microbulbifer halophilus]|uniref:PepSY-associated TM helix domain-containing protein n=1 Tax=Microbulbifer halophilus TaxID=453963 RepID=A0ABW5E6Y2_9GAMM|nr:PepSY-associated TM helix domain-containing protein [Microbulbifer halophilus]MCW8127258.1 PepSY-associated TM helix domain-containing protein [Microbulbifer halophilus]
MTIDRLKWYRLHSWAGLKLSLLLSFVLVTGTLATVSHEIDWLFNPAMRVQAPVEPVEYQWAALYRSARAAHPEAQLLSIEAPVDSWFAVEAVALDANGKRFRIYMDPTGSRVTGTGRWYNWQRFFRQAHRHLMLPLAVGIPIVCATAFLLLIALVTGIVCYRGWWKGFGKLPRSKQRSGKGRRKASRRYWGQLHRLLGVWSLWFIVLIAMTGIWYLAERWGLHASYPPPVTAPASDGPIEPTEETITAVVQAARQIYPEIRIRSILLPRKAGESLRLRGQAEALLVRDRANQMAFDPRRGELLETRRGDRLGIHLRISEAADPLHFGTFGGRTSRWLWFLFGCFLSALSLSGVHLYGLRTVNSARSDGSSWRFAWRGMGHWKWLAGLLLGLCLGTTAALFS